MNRSEMKVYRNDADTIRVGAYEKNGKYYIVIEKLFNRWVATRNSTKAHIEQDFSHYEKVFNSKEQANAYFGGIKKNNPTLKEM